MSAENWKNYEVRATRKKDEAIELIREGYEYVCDVGQTRLFRNHDRSEQEARIAYLDHCTSQMQGYKVYLLTLVIGFLGAVESIRALGLAFEAFRCALSLAFGILGGSAVFFLERALWFGELARRTMQRDKDEFFLLDRLDEHIDPQRPKAKPGQKKIGASDSKLAGLSILVGVMLTYVIWLTIGCLANYGWIDPVPLSR